MEIDYKKLQEILKHEFADISLLRDAFTHRSFLNECIEEGRVSNERLEFLGDAVLQFLTSEYIFSKFPDFPEGQLTNLRSKLVNTESLASESARMKISEHLLVSKGEKSSVVESNHMQANLFEAVLGALYLDSGIETCKEFLVNNLFYKSKNIIDDGTLKDAKSLYQELAQELYGITPLYKVLEDFGPDHNKVFTIAVFLDGKEVAKGTGASKRKAQQDAAKNALKLEKKLTEWINSKN
jgi:ribonuclease III